MTEAHVPTFWDPAKSPFASVLHTNHRPSTEQLAELETWLLEPEQELYRLESEIVRVQRLLGDLWDSYGQTKAYIDAHRALMSPVRRLPPETLSEILMCCVPDSYPTRYVREAPLILTTICREWRFIALNTPQLWSSLHLSLPVLRSGEEVARWETGVDEWLSRSRALPLRISLHSEISLGAAVDDIQYPIIQSFLRYRERFAELSLSLPYDDLLMLASLGAPEGFPSMKRLKIQEQEWDELDDPNLNSVSSPFAAQMPALTQLEIENHTPMVKHYLGLPCQMEALTVLLLCRGSEEYPLLADDMLAILARTPRLQRCELQVSFNQVQGGADQPWREVRLEFLRELSVEFHNNNAASDENDPTLHSIPVFFKSLALPSLRSLSIKLSSSHTLSQVPFANSPLHELETLRLEIPMTPEALTQCFKLVPGMKTFEMFDLGRSVRTDVASQSTSVRDSSIYVTALQDSHLVDLARLTSLENSNELLPVLCPRLQELRFIISRTRHSFRKETKHMFTTTALTNLIESRTSSRLAPESRLRFFDMSMDPAFTSHPPASTSHLIIPRPPGSFYGADFMNMNDITSGLKFDPAIFRDSSDLNFERDFGQWFNPDEIGGSIQ